MTSIRRKRKRKSVRRKSIRRKSIRKRSVKKKSSNRSRKRKSIRRRSIRRKSMKGGALNALGKGTAITAGAVAIGKTSKKIYDLKKENKRLQKKEAELKELKEQYATAIQKKEEQHATAIQKKEEQHAKAIQNISGLWREERNKLLQLQEKYEEEKEQHDKLVHSIHETDIILNKPKEKAKAKEIFRLATGDENGVIHFDDFKDCIRFSYTDEITDEEIDFLEDVFNEESGGGNIYETEMSIEEFVNFISRDNLEIDLDDMIECLKQKQLDK